MRLPDDRFRRLARRIGLSALTAAALGGCAGDYDEAASLASVPAVAGPAADYPVVVGEPYRVGNTLYTPADTLNYDEVGHVADDVGTGVSGAHRTLPLPSYAEVTSLETGRTILVRLERRGPMTGDALVGLSPAALAELGATSGTAVRLRRVNPPEDERAMLRSGQAAPQRMETPESLLAVLRRKLPPAGSAQLAAGPSPIPAVEVAPSAAARELPPATAPAPAPADARPPLPAPALPPLRGPAAAPAQTSGQPVVVASLPPQQLAQPVQTAPRAAPPPQVQARPAAEGAWVVQIAALSSFERAQRVAGAIGGHVEQSGSLYRIRTGPFATRGQAEASLAKVRAAGYSEARIFTNG
jgi:rare lipoprotein A